MSISAQSFFFVSIQKYVAVGELGKATDTLDATGSVTQEKDFGIRLNENEHLFQLAFLFCSINCALLCVFFTLPGHVTKADLEEKLKAFTGDIMQVPPL